jgi:hypothetical protein
MSTSYSIEDGFIKAAISVDKSDSSDFSITSLTGIHKLNIKFFRTTPSYAGCAGVYMANIEYILLKLTQVLNTSHINVLSSVSLLTGNIPYTVGYHQPRFKKIMTELINALERTPKKLTLTLDEFFYDLDYFHQSRISNLYLLKRGHEGTHTSRSFARNISTRLIQNSLIQNVGLLKYVYNKFSPGYVADHTDYVVYTPKDYASIYLMLKEGNIDDRLNNVCVRKPFAKKHAYELRINRACVASFESVRLYIALARRFQPNSVLAMLSRDVLFYILSFVSPWDWKSTVKVVRNPKLAQEGVKVFEHAQDRYLNFKSSTSYLKRLKSDSYRNDLIADMERCKRRIDQLPQLIQEEEERTLKRKAEMTEMVDEFEKLPKELGKNRRRRKKKKHKK